MIRFRRRWTVLRGQLYRSLDGGVTWGHGGLQIWGGPDL